MSFKIAPLADHLVVKRKESEQKTASGLIIPETAQERALMGTVVAAGKGRLSDTGSLIPLEIPVGSTVLFPKFSGIDIKFENEEFLILRESDIFALIK